MIVVEVVRLIVCLIDRGLDNTVQPEKVCGQAR